MTLPAWCGRRPARWQRHSIAALGALMIVAIVGLTIDDGMRSHRATRDKAWAELDALARAVAEQTARSLQAVDVVLRYLAAEHDAGTLAAMTPQQLHIHLKEQAVGLVQTDVIALFNGDGTPRASSKRPPGQLPNVNAMDDPQFRALRDAPGSQLVISDARFRRAVGLWAFPISRPLRSASGAFDGSVTALGRVDYFQDFYRDLAPQPGTRISLRRRDTSLLARHPPVPELLGKTLPAIAQLMASAAPGQTTGRTTSTLDGQDRLGAIREVADYPLVVVVARDATAVFAEWRALAWRLALRTAALAGLAGLLLALTLRQLRRTDTARRSLEVSQERFALAAAGSDDGIWDWDLVAGAGYESARARALQGLPGEPETQPLDTLQALPTHVPEDAVLRRNAMAALLAGHSDALEGEYRVRLPGGDVRWIRVRGLCIRGADGQCLRIAGSVSDVDARKQAEQSLRRSEERYQLAVQGSNEGMWDWELAQDTLFLSPRAQEVAFGEAGEPLRSRDEWTALLRCHPDDIERVRAAITRHLQGATPHFTVEFRVQHWPDLALPAAGWHWCRQRGIALRDGGGRVYRMAGSIEDITARKEAQAGRQRLEKQLQQAQKLEAIGTLAGGIAHDFNNILAAIIGFGEMARADAPAGSRQRGHIDASLAAGARAKSLVERILAFSRTGVGERVPVHVQSVVAEALDMVAATLPGGIRLQRRLAAGDAGLMGDPTQVHQVVMNLCANAVQASTAPAVVVVDASVVDLAAPLAVATSTLAPGRYVKLAVRDAGSGIPAHLLERIFDPFFTTREVGVGTGLGLSLVHGIVADLGGGIAIESRAGAGSVFTAYFSTASTTAPPLPVADVAPAGNGQTVLLVDDETALVELGEETLAALGYEPVAFSSSAAALHGFRADPGRFDLVLADEAMPGMTGCELATELRGLRADIPILLMSGFVTTAMLQRARDAGVDDVLGKPLALGELARSLAAALGAARSANGGWP